jgi:hypothetical protein
VRIETLHERRAGQAGKRPCDSRYLLRRQVARRPESEIRAEFGAAHHHQRQRLRTALRFTGEQVMEAVPFLVQAEGVGRFAVVRIQCRIHFAGIGEQACEFVRRHSGKTDDDAHPDTPPISMSIGAQAASDRDGAQPFSHAYSCRKQSTGNRRDALRAG